MTNLALPSTFPTEIYERIIQWVSNRTQVRSIQAEKLSLKAYLSRLSTLCSCALTCRAWLPTSRACLYHHLAFFSIDRISFERLVCSLNAKPWLGTLIVALAVIDNHKTTVDSKVSNSERAGDISHTWPIILAGKISKLPHLHTLHLTFADGLARHAQYMTSLQRIGTTVTTLSFRWYYSGSFADLVRIISVFPNLRTLTLVGRLWTPKGNSSGIPLRRFPPLSKLAITNSQPYKDDMWKDITYKILRLTASSIDVLELDEACVPYLLLGLR
ncbi:hypothetical protein C8Q70DRAFT_596665 [Cubamyces menziesii]|nr:hypothetical protein C8Q70DRAFT_596665 [Cubamyces menziesii]